MVKAKLKIMGQGGMQKKNFVQKRDLSFRYEGPLGQRNMVKSWQRRTVLMPGFPSNFKEEM